MRISPVLALAFLSLAHAQDSPVLKSVEPDYAKYSQHLLTDYVEVNASVTLTVLANGKPFELYKSTVALPGAVIMALKDYEFRPQGAVPHGQPETKGDTYQVTINVPVRQSRTPIDTAPDRRRVGTGITKGLLTTHVPPVYSDFIRHNRLQGRVDLQVRITKEGSVDILTVSDGPLALLAAAHDAVQQWQYRPYLLNNQPVEVLTDVDVRFASN